MGFSVEDAVAVIEMIEKEPVFAYEKMFRRTAMPWTEKLLTALFVDKIQKVAETGAFSIGKTYDQPPVAQMWIWDHAPSAIVIPGAPKMEQSVKHFWVEYRKMHDEISGAIGGVLNDLSGEWRSDIPGCYIKSMAPAQRQTEAGKKAFTGFGTHAEFVLWMGDDSQGIEKPTFEAVNNVTSTGGSAQAWFGNPIYQGGPWFALAQKPDCLHIIASALDHPNVKAWMEGKPPLILAAVAPGWVDEMVFDHCSPVTGEIGPLDFQWFEFQGRMDTSGRPYKIIWFRPDPWFVGNVLGQFPDISTDSLVSYADVHTACNRAVTPMGDPVTCGLDPAEYGSDETVFDLRYETVEGVDYHEQIVYPGRNDPADVIGYAMELLRQFPRMKLYGDMIGVGSAVMAVLMREFPGRAFGVKWSPKKPVRVGNPRDPHVQYADFRTQLQFYVAALFSDGEISVNHDQRFISETCSVKWELNSKGKRVVQSKVARREEIGEELKSPGRWEGVCYSYAGDLLNVTHKVKHTDSRFVHRYRTVEHRLATTSSFPSRHIHRTGNRSGHHRCIKVGT